MGAKVKLSPGYHIDWVGEYESQQRAQRRLAFRGDTILDATIEGSVLKLRPIMMTKLVAALGLVPAAVSHGIGCDSQCPFARGL